MKFSVPQYTEALYHTLSETKAADHDKVIGNFIRILKTNGDLAHYEAIIAEYETLDRKMKGVREVEVTTAHDAAVSKDVVNKLNDIIGDDIELKQKVDETLIGGIVVKVEDILIDASVKGQLNKLKNNLSQ
jgi:F-type H+-transporting ATPase subunit delta